MHGIRPLPVSVRRRMGSSGAVVSGRVSGDRGDGTVCGRLVTAAAARGRCRLASHWLLGTKRPALDGRIWRGPWLADVWEQLRTGFPVWRRVARCRLVGDCGQVGKLMGRPAA